MPTFSNSTPVIIADTQTANTSISVSGLVGQISNIYITLNNLSHAYSSDLDLLLVGPDGIHNLEFFSDAAAGGGLAGTYVIRDDAASTLPPNLFGGNLASGSYQPSDYQAAEAVSNWAGLPNITVNHASINGTASFASSFNQSGPNGTWTLWIRDAYGGDAGALAGWSLDIETQGGGTTAFPPTINPDGFTVAANSGVTSLAVLANDAPARGGDTLSIGSISGFDQSTGTLSIAGGTILYTPAAGYTGTTSFNYTAASSSGGSAGATATIRVIASGTPTTGNDNLTGTDAADTVMLLAGNDTYRGGLGNDVAFGNQGDDVLYGNQGADTLYGGQGADSLYGGQDADVQFGNADADVLFGNLGSDVLYGGQGNDTLFGGQGDDLLFGDRGDDVLSGDLGADRYVFGQASGNDLILGFNQGEGDRISLQGQTYTVGSASNGNALLTLSGGGTVELRGFQASAVNASFFA